MDDEKRKSKSGIRRSSSKESRRSRRSKKKKAPSEGPSDASSSPAAGTSTPATAATPTTTNRVINSPPGLEYLAQVDQLVIRQELQLLEVFTGWEQNNRYLITNAANQPAYYAVEMNDFFTVNMLGANRPWQMIILDNYRREVLRMVRPFRPRECACVGIVQILQVHSAGVPLGTVEQVWRFCGAQFRVRNPKGETVLWIEGPPCHWNWADTDFTILSPDGTVNVGVITRHFPGFFNAMFTKVDIFGVRFPLDMDVATKAVLLAATFLIDFMYFEERDRHHDGHHGRRFGPPGFGGGHHDGFHHDGFHHGGFHHGGHMRHF